jgi:hypothetical protein
MPRQVHPHRVASWSVDLFTAIEQTEAIQGDLLEEFSGLVSTSGIDLARRWYWRQSVKTIAHLVGGGLRGAPWRIASVVLRGYLLLSYSSMLSERVIVAVLLLHPIYPNYDHKNVVALWMFVPLAIHSGWIIASMLVGCIVAMAIKGKEMVATSALGLVFLIPRSIGAILDRAPSLSMDVFLLSCMASFVIGGGLVRKIRGATAPVVQPFTLSSAGDMAGRGTVCGS